MEVEAFSKLCMVLFGGVQIPYQFIALRPCFTPLTRHAPWCLINALLHGGLSFFLCSAVFVCIPDCYISRIILIRLFRGMDTLGSFQPVFQREMTFITYFWLFLKQNLVRKGVCSERKGFASEDVQTVLEHDKACCHIQSQSVCR